MGQTAEIAPADGRLYALRDVTATVDCLPLIVSSILCKKLAEGIEALLLDVKVGRGAFMKTMPEAEALSAALVEVCGSLGVKAVALITEMEQPLGNAVGNALEVEEAIQSLKGKGPSDLFELTLALGSWMLFLAKKAENLEKARERLKDLWEKGYGLEKFAQWVEAQGGDPSSLLAGQGLPKAPQTMELRSWASGFVQAIDAEAIGLLARDLGAGRRRMGDPIDHAAGILLYRKVGEEIGEGELLGRIFCRRGMEGAEERLRGAIRIGESRPASSPLVRKVIGEWGSGEGLGG